MAAVSSGVASCPPKSGVPCPSAKTFHSPTDRARGRTLPQPIEHHRSAEDRADRVGDPCSGDVPEP